MSYRQTIRASVVAAVPCAAQTSTLTSRDSATSAERSALRFTFSSVPVGGW